jgi:hypothetical protein
MQDDNSLSFDELESISGGNAPDIGARQQVSDATYKSRCGNLPSQDPCYGQTYDLLRRAFGDYKGYTSAIPQYAKDALASENAAKAR